MNFLFGKYRCRQCGKRIRTKGWCHSCFTVWFEKRPVVDESCNDFESCLKLLEDAIKKEK